MIKKLDEIWKDDLSNIYKNLCNHENRRMSFRRGIVVADDEFGDLLNDVNSILHFEQIKQLGYYNEITIDKHWPFNDDDLFRGKLIEEAERTNGGLLRINITDKRVFDEFHCKIIKELSKREEDDFNLDIYVLLVIKGLTWKEVEDYAAKHSMGQFNDMMSQWYRRIM